MDTSADQDVVFEFGPYRLDPAARRIDCEGAPIHLQPKAFDLLCVLVERRGLLVRKADLLARVWPDTAVDEGVLAVHVSALRKLLPLAGGGALIEAEPRAGYRFVVPVRAVPRGNAREKPAAAAAPPAESPVTTAHTELPDAPDAAGASRALAGHGRRPRLVWGAAALAIAAAAVAGAWGWRAATADRARPVRVLAVLPMAALGGQEDAAHLEVGMADAIITRLAGVPELGVLPTAAVRPLAADPRPPVAIGRALGVDGIVTGTLQRADDRIRVTVQLTRVSDGWQIWAGRFDEPFTHLFSLQDAIAEQVAAELVDTVGPLAGRRATASIDAYVLYIRGRELWARRTPESIRTAIELYEKAVAIDPQFALAYAGLADAYAITVSGLPPAERFPKARAAVERALALDPLLAEAYNTRGFLAYKADWRWTDAERDFRRAIELNPRYGLTYHWYGEFLGLLGRYDEALERFARARQLDPYSIAIILDMTFIQRRLGLLDEARAALEQALEINRSDARIYAAMSEVLQVEGRHDEAFEWTIRGRRLAGADESQIEALREGYAREGHLGRIRADLPALQRAAETGDPWRPNAAGTLAGVYGMLGETELAFEWLAEAIRRREDTALQLRRHPAFDALRGDPRFGVLERQVGMP